MKKTFLMLLSCVIAFTMVITVSANSGKSPGVGKDELLIDMSGHPENDKNINESDDMDMVADTSEETDVSEVPDEIEVPETVNVRFDLTSPDLCRNLYLVNKVNRLDGRFIPQGLSAVLSKMKSPAIPSRKSGTVLKNDALTALNSMNMAALGAGINDMVLSSGYRSYSEQNSLYVRKVKSLAGRYGRKTAEVRAAAVVAAPGSSEHQTGLAVDITTRQLMKRSDPLVEEFAYTTCGKWMAAHSWEFGYVLRYQADKVQITGIVNEPWHFRYVGKLHAEVMKKNKMCLEEYIKLLKNKSSMSFTDASGNNYDIAFVCPVKGTDILNVVVDKGSCVEISKVDTIGYVISVKKPIPEDGK